MNIDEIKTLLNGLGTRHFVSGDGECILIPFARDNAKVHVLVRLNDDGDRLHLACKDLESIDVGAANSSAVFQEMLALNYKVSMAKLAHDPTDGEVVLLADTWIVDGVLGAQQLDRIIDNFAFAAFEAKKRLKAVATTGKTSHDLAFESFLESCVVDFGADQAAADPSAEAA